jgi:hypothetical protein
MDTLIFILFLLVSTAIGLGIYLIPTIIAVKVNHPNKASIIVLNILAGWTFIIWVISLVWALSKPAVYPAGAHQYQQATPGPVMPRRQEPTVADFNQRPIQNVQASRPLLVCVKGFFAGQAIDLNYSPVVIGRDASVSHLVYPADINWISSKHCVVSYDWEKQNFVLEDSSENGTFVYPQNRLSKGCLVYLEAGARFYLANPLELYEVRYG